MRQLLGFVLLLFSACTPQPPKPEGKPPYPFVAPYTEPPRPQPKTDRPAPKPTTASRPIPTPRPTPPVVNPLPAQDVVTYRFIDALPKASLTPKGPLGAVRGSKRFFLNPHATLKRSLEAHNIRYGIWDSRFGRVDMRNSLRLAVPTTLRYPVTLLPASRITFGVLVPGRAQRRRVRLTVRVRGKLICTREYAPMRFPPVRDWIDESCDLGPVAPGPGQVEFRVEWTAGPPSGDDAEVLLADPVMLSRLGPNSTHRRQIEAIIGKGRPINVIYIVVDALRSDVLDPQRRPFPSVTPVMDALLASGTTFTQAFGNSNQTRSSTVAMLSGRYLSALGLTTPWWIINPRLKAHFYDQRPPLLPLLLRKHGYVTQAIANNQFIFGNLYLGLDLGFDGAIDFREATRDTVHITERAEQFIRRNRDRRFFLFVNYNAPHTPYLPPEKYRRIVESAMAGRRFLLHKNYVGEIAYTDEFLGRLLGVLDELDLRRRTLIIFTADHGEIMNPKHACRSVRFYAPCHYSHGLTFYDEELNVPLALSLPGVIKPGLTVRKPVTHVDVAPTIMSLLGLPVSTRFDGKSLETFLTGGTEKQTRLVFSEGRTGWSIRWGGFKYIHHNWASDFQTPAMRTAGPVARTELYDLTRDPREETNLAATQLKLAQELKRRLFAYQATLAQRGKRQLLSLRSGSRPPSLTRRTMVSQRPSPTTRPKPTTTAPKVPPVTHFLVFNGQGSQPHRYQGYVETTGRLSLLAPAPGKPAPCVIKGAHRLVCAATVSGDARRVRFQITPAQAPLVFRFTLDGKPIGASQIYVGSNGIALLDAKQRLASPRLQQYSVAGRRGPRFLRGDDLGLFYWRDRYFDPVTAKPIIVPIEHRDDSLDRNMSKQMRTLLRNMGYAK